MLGKGAEAHAPVLGSESLALISSNIAFDTLRWRQTCRQYARPRGGCHGRGQPMHACMTLRASIITHLEIDGRKSLCMR